MSLTRVTYTAEREETLLGALDYFIDEGFGNQEELYREIAKYLGLQWGKSISRASIKAKVNHLWERCYGKGTPQNKKISLEGSSCLDLKKAVLGNNSSSSKIKRAKEQVRDNVQAWKQPRAIRAEGQTSTRTADVSGPQDGGGLRNDAGTAHDLGGGTEDAIMVDAEDPVSLVSLAISSENFVNTDLLVSRRSPLKVPLTKAKLVAP